MMIESGRLEIDSLGEAYLDKDEMLSMSLREEKENRPILGTWI